jgi:hypothetical protein
MSNNILHIITPAYRLDNLEKVYNSILTNDDIVWHISKSSKTEKINFDFIKSDNRIRFYDVDCDDSDTTTKRNVILNTIKNGYFCFLDDDTIFHKNMYIKYLECKDNNFIGMLIGEQLDKNGKLRLTPSSPIYTKIDTGNVLSHSNCLSICKWPETHQHRKNAKDFLFWESVYKFYNNKCTIWNQPISYYNKLR